MITALGSSEYNPNQQPYKQDLTQGSTGVKAEKDISTEVDDSDDKKDLNEEDYKHIVNTQKMHALTTRKNTLLAT